MHNGRNFLILMSFFGILNIISTPEICFSQTVVDQSPASKKFTEADLRKTLPNGEQIHLLARKAEEIANIMMRTMNYDDDEAKSRANKICTNLKFKLAKRDYKTESVDLGGKLYDLPHDAVVIAAKRCYLPSFEAQMAFLDPHNQFDNKSIPDGGALNEVFPILMEKNNFCDEEVVKKALKAGVAKEAKNFSKDDQERFYKRRSENFGVFPLGRIETDQYFSELTCSNIDD